MKKDYRNAYKKDLKKEISLLKKYKNKKLSKDQFYKQSPFNQMYSFNPNAPKYSKSVEKIDDDLETKYSYSPADQIKIESSSSEIRELEREKKELEKWFY